jgi:hypothetical protein
VIAALYEAFGEGETTRLTDRHLERAIVQTVPQSRSLEQAITRLRAEARDKWRPASLEATNLEPTRNLWEGGEEPPTAPRRKRIFEV